ncbi:MAG: DUF4080 domain-containing protein [Pseudomonadota bacterium]|jgi:radical SAM superfamily enzyme YgiQ (UPF0313 family)
MAEILLATINARFIHTSFGLRYLFANLGELQSRCELREFENSQTAKAIAESIVLSGAEIVGLGVYIWNVTRTREVVSILRQVRPELIIILGGPEVSYEFEEQPLFELCDYLITGEADLSFAVLCRQLVAGQRPVGKVIHSGLPALSTVVLPYKHYTEGDIASRVIYVEVSRGCPFTCEFCLSSIDIPVRQFDHQAVLVELAQLYSRGARVFKFVDRTFNLNVRTANDILSFFLDRMEPGLFVHFEMVPDRFPQQLRETVAAFPPGALQLEIGVQTLNPEVGALISRRQDVSKLIDNIRFLRSETSAHLHIDLIVGLPGEGIESFANGFNTLVELNPHEIQVGILKRLKGTPIVRHTEKYQMRYSEEPPYEVLATSELSFLDIQRLERFARYWDLVANSGNFLRSRALLWDGADNPFSGFMEWCEWLYAQVGRRASIELKTLTGLLFRFLVDVRRLDCDRVGSSLAEDYRRGGRNDLPKELRSFDRNQVDEVRKHTSATKRQSRVVGG